MDSVSSLALVAELSSGLLIGIFLLILLSAFFAGSETALLSISRAKVHALLSIENYPRESAPGYFPVAWTKEYGQGKVFYTSLGHRDDLWDLNPDLKERKNSVETAKAFQEHVLGGIKWALGAAAK